MNNQIIPVSFDGDTLALVNQDGEPFVAMRPAAENLRLDWKSQWTKLNEKFGSSVALITTTGGDGKQYEMVCLPLRKFPAWVYSINPSKVKPELRDKVIRYQEECDDVLWKYWTQGHAERPGANRPSFSQQLAAHGVRLRLLKHLQTETDPALRTAIHQQLDHASRMLDVPTPEIDAIGHAEAPQPVPALVDAFWEAVELIGLEKLNHSRDRSRIAVSLLHFAQVAAAEKVHVPDVQGLRQALRRSESPQFIDLKTVNSALLSRSVKCWVFESVPRQPQRVLHELESGDSPGKFTRVSHTNGETADADSVTT